VESQGWVDESRGTVTEVGDVFEEGTDGILEGDEKEIFKGTVSELVEDVV
jgi:hypothetical protein